MSQHPSHAEPTTGSALTSSDAGHPHLGIWHTGNFDQPRPQVLLKERPVSAASAANSSLVAWGTSLIVMDFGTAAVAAHAAEVQALEAPTTLVPPFHDCHVQGVLSLTRCVCVG